MLCPAILHIDNATITSRANKAFIRATVEPVYQGCLEKKHKWTPDIQDAIAWHCLAIAIRNTDNTVHTTRVYNKALVATAARMNITRQQNHEICASCGLKEDYMNT